MKWHPASPALMTILRCIALMATALIAACDDPGVSMPQGLVWEETEFQGQAELRLLGQAASGRRVLWWNIMKGELNAQLKASTGQSPLDVNLRAIVQSDLAPDVIVLGECHPAMLEQATRELLEFRYPHHSAYGYNPDTQELGICLYSARPVKESQGQPLDWTPLELSGESERQAWRSEWRKSSSDAKEYKRTFERTYRTYEILGDDAFVVIPFHALQPWDLIAQERGSLRTSWDLLTDKDNPLVYQTQRLLRAMHQDFGPELDAAPLVLIGDFNVPKTLNAEIHVMGYPIDPARLLSTNMVPSPRPRTHTYALVSEKLGDAFVEEPFTFPASSDSKRGELKYDLHPLKLDHAFVSKKLLATHALVPRLRGSDHYPIYVVVEPAR